MPTVRKLRNVHFTRVDRVMNPANPESRITLAKSAKLDKGSTEELWTEARAAIEAKFGEESWARELTWAGTDTKAGRIVFSANGDLMAITYAIDESGDLSLVGEPVEVRAEFVPVTKGNEMADNDNTLDLDDDEAVTAFLEGMMAYHEPETPEVTDEQLAELIDATEAEVLVDMAKGKVVLAKSADDPDDVETIIKKGKLDDATAALLRKQAKDSADNAAAIAKMQADARIESFRKSAATDMGDLTEKSDDLGELLAAVATALGADDHAVVKDLTRVLKAASAQAAEATTLLTKSRGVDGERIITKATQEIQDLAVELAKSEGITVPQAKIRVAQSHPDLVKAHYDEAD